MFFILAQQNLQESGTGESSQYIPWTNDEIDRMVKARLDLPVVEKLRQEGYSMAIIRYISIIYFKKIDMLFLIFSIEKYMKCNYDLKVVLLLKKLINVHDKNFVLFLIEDDFKTDVDLRVACLILDKQVKLINGNEANILIPQNWMKKYLEDQEAGTHSQEVPRKQTLDIQSMNYSLDFCFNKTNIFIFIY